ncbi:MAG: Inner spore coat protein H [Flavobacteriales bacterium UBA4585]|nr:MAG: Inner spore coat protein H [Flavobacteriales bacterium UBA4585]
MKTSCLTASKRVAFALLFLFSSTLKSQSFYDIGTIQEIKIVFSQSNWDYMLDTAKAGDESYLMAQTVTINGTVFDSVGVKYKGNSTYKANQTKNPWHIELDTYKPQDYQGFKDIKLSNVAKDPSFLREVLTYEVARKYMVAPRSNYAVVYVNGSQIGLYSNSEAISKTFIKLHLSSNTETFIKCNPPAGAGPGTTDYPNLVYEGTDSVDYYAGYELKSDHGWDDLIAFTDTLKNHVAAIEEFLNVDQTLWMHAFNNGLVNLDSYSGGFAQNYYLYRMENGQFYPVVWDMNESFGQFSMTGTINLTNTTSKAQMTHLLHSNDASWPLIQKLLSVPMYKRMYLAHLKTIITENFTSNSGVNASLFYNRAQALYSLIDNAVSLDPNKLTTYAQFQSNITNDVTSGGGGGPGGGGPGGGSSPGLKNLMDARATYLLGLSDLSATQPTISNVIANVPGALPASGFITANVTNATAVYVHVRDSIDGRYIRNEMYDDGQHGDGAANDGVFGASIYLQSVQKQFYIYADAATIGRFSPERAGFEYHTVGFQTPTTGLVINEFMASNDGTIADSNGDYNDWIELYNASNSPINLGDYALSDDLSNPTKFELPNTVLASGDFVLFWASSSAQNDPYHAPFKLSKSGEEVALFFDPTGAADTVDYISYSAQTTDVSFGRSYDASPNWITFTTATPDASNGMLDLEEQHGPGLTIFPNPHSGNFTLDNTWPTAMTVRCYSMQGRLVDVIQLEGYSKLNVSDLRLNQPLILHYESEMGSGYLKLISWK